MKNILKITTLLLTGLVTAQELPILSTTSLANPNDEFKHWETGNYAIDTANERQQYVGLWRYDDGETLFDLKIEILNQRLVKAEYEGDLKFYYYTDIVVLKYKLIKNGVVVHNNLDVPTNNIDSITNFGNKEINEEFLRGRIYDYYRQVVGSYAITKLSGTPEKILFNLYEFGYSIKGDPSMYQPGIKLFSIPTAGIEMVKVD